MTRLFIKYGISLLLTVFLIGLCGCNSNLLNVRGVSVQPNGVEIAIYTYPIGDGVALGTRITKRGERPQFYPIKLASQPSLPLTTVKAFYSNTEMAWWIECTSDKFYSLSYYSVSNNVYIDEYGTMTSFGDSPKEMNLGRRHGFVPAIPADKIAVLDVQVGEKGGTL